MSHVIWTQVDLLSAVADWPTPPGFTVTVDCRQSYARLTLQNDTTDGKPSRTKRYMARKWPLSHARTLLDAMAVEVEIRAGWRDYTGPLNMRLNEAGNQFDGWVTRWCMERDGWTDEAVKACVFKPGFVPMFVSPIMWCGIPFAMVAAMGLILPWKGKGGKLA